MSKNLEHEFERQFVTWQVAQLRNLPKRARQDILTRIVLQGLVKLFNGEHSDAPHKPPTNEEHDE
jgi:hypothetical protein